MAIWLDTAFSAFDRAIFVAMNNLALNAGDFFTPLFKVITFLGDKGWAFLLAGLILMLFKNTRKIGVGFILAVACGALLTNIILKNLVDRTRPFLANNEYHGFWQIAGGEFEDESSFPSGHTTATMASMMVLFLSCNKKWSWVGFIFALLMGITRVYFVVHYTTDVIAGLISGAIGGVGGYYLTKLLYNFCHKNSQKKLFDFFINFDVIEQFRKK